MTFTYWMSTAETRKRFHLLKDCVMAKPGQEPLDDFLIHPHRQRLDCPKELVRRHTQFDGPSTVSNQTFSGMHIDDPNSRE